MYKRILITTDGSELAAKGIIHALQLAKAVGAEIVAVMVTSTDPGNVVAGPLVIVAPPEVVKEANDYAERCLRTVADAAAKMGLTCQSEHVISDLTHQAIIETADRKGCDLIVMSSHGHGGFKSILLGSVVLKVLAHSQMPVLVCR